MIFVGVLLVAWIAEILLRSFWVPVYFRYGLPVYWARYRITEFPSDMDAVRRRLEGKLFPPKVYDRQVFEPIGLHELAFALVTNPKLMLHGRIKFDHNKDECVFTGFCPWSLMFIILSLFVIAFEIIYPINLLSFVCGGFLIFLVWLGIATLRNAYGRLSNAVQDVLNE